MRQYYDTTSLSLLCIDRMDWDLGCGKLQLCSSSSMDASFGIVRDNGQEGMVSPRGSFSIQIADSHALKYFIYLISIEVHDVFRRFLVKNCQELRRDVVCCSSAISCIGGQRRWQHALQLLQQMLEPGSNGGFVHILPLVPVVPLDLFLCFSPSSEETLFDNSTTRTTTASFWVWRCVFTGQYSKWSQNVSDNIWKG